MGQNTGDMLAMGSSWTPHWGAQWDPSCRFELKCGRTGDRDLGIYHHQVVFKFIVVKDRNSGADHVLLHRSLGKRPGGGGACL